MPSVTYRSYEHAIDVIGAAGPGRSAHQRSSISIKLSALEPRYSLLQQGRVMQRLVPRVRDLARRAAKYGIQLTIDAEEADRLDLSLDVIEALAGDSATREWPGLGLAVQAYSQTRAGCHRVGGRDRTLERPALGGTAGQGRLLGQ